MKGISISGHKLHKVEMLTVPYDAHTVSYLSYPKSRINFTIGENEMVLTIPPLLVLELYRKGVIPRDENESFPIQVSGKKVGVFKIVEFRYPNSYSEDSVTIRLKRQ